MANILRSVVTSSRRGLLPHKRLVDWRVTVQVCTRPCTTQVRPEFFALAARLSAACIMPVLDQGGCGLHVPVQHCAAPGLCRRCAQRLLGATRRCEAVTPFQAAMSGVAHQRPSLEPHWQTCKLLAGREKESRDSSADMGAAQSSLNEEEAELQKVMTALRNKLEAIELGLTQAWCQLPCCVAAAETAAPHALALPRARRLFCERPWSACHHEVTQRCIASMQARGDNSVTRQTEVSGGRTVMRTSEIRAATNTGVDKQILAGIHDFFTAAHGGIDGDNQGAKHAAVAGAEKVLGAGINALLGVKSGQSQEKRDFIILFLNNAFVRVRPLSLPSSGLASA